jgi:serine/threonine protein kinase
MDRGQGLAVPGALAGEALVTPERWLRVERLFREALTHPLAERRRFLESACRGDSDLLREVLSLLASHEEAGSFLDAPVLAFLPGAALAAAADSADVHTFLSGQMVADRFRIVRFLAEGGMGEVYEALDTERHEEVALKTIRRTILDDEEAEGRFARESQLARKVIHPNVCRIHDVFEHVVRSGNHEARIRCLSMELLAGETLGRRLRRTGKLSAARALPIALQIAQALKAAHDVGVIHRDLKPDNVILVPGKNEIRAVVTDFGIARADRTFERVPAAARLDLLWMLHGLQADASASKGALARLARRARSRMAALGLVSEIDGDLTELGRVLGTPAYMSPEQARGVRVDQRTDVWSFGVLFYEMLTGQLPYRPEGSPGRSLRKLFGRERRPSARGIPRALRPSIFRCLSISRGGRYQRMDALLEDLSRTRLERGHSKRALVLWIAVLSALAGVLLVRLYG